MTQDDDLLAAYDLSAWDVPPPAAGLVDAVIDRAREPASVPALDTVERMGPRRTRRWWIAAAAAAAVAIVAIVVGVWGVQRPPKDEQGEVSAQAARALAIGSTTAALDPGTTVRWRRDKRRISVAQPRGTAMWTVAAEDTLVIDAGAMVASVEASGASLRVEVEMVNASDARAIGISAATAVAVALVTIVVYEGTVRVRHDGQTVNVVPGAHYEVRPPNAPEPIAVGGGPSDARIRELEDKIKVLEIERDAARTMTKTCDEVACVLTNYSGACCAKFKAAAKPPTQPAVPETLDRAAISGTMQPLTSKVLACPADGLDGIVKLRVVVGPDGSVTSATTSVTKAPVPAPLAYCIEAIVRAATFPRTVLGGSFVYPFKYAASAPVATCDADALREKGDDHLQNGMDGAALAAFEASMRCKNDPTLYRRAFLAACRSKNTPKARLYYPRLPAKDQGALSVMCVRNGISVGDEPTSCDAAALAEKGDDHLQSGMNAAALAAFEASLACTPDPMVARKAFMAACRSKNVTKAQRFYATLPPNQRSSLAQLCIRNGIQLDAPKAAGGVIKVASTPPAQIYLDGVDTGKTTPATVQATAGNHKITLSVKGDKFTYTVRVKEGETVTFSKDIQ